jgi:GNAT superfamily N-acetyltransferase
MENARFSLRIDHVERTVVVADILDPPVAVRIHVLQHAAYSVEAQRIGSCDFPSLRETLDALRHCPNCFLVFVEDGNIIGCLSYAQSGAAFTITSLVVCPQHLRRGIASAWLRKFESRLPAGSVVCASTADLNDPAIRAYEKQSYGTAVGPALEDITLRRLHQRVDGENGQIQPWSIIHPVNKPSSKTAKANPKSKSAGG